MQFPTILRGIFSLFSPDRRRSSEYRALAADAQANLEALAGFWNRVKPPLGEDEIHWVHKVVYARQLAEAELPGWRRSAFDSWQRSGSSSLSPRSAARVVRFYQDLDAISRAHYRLSAALSRDLLARADARSSPTVSLPLTFENFLRDAGMTWTEVWHQVERLLNEGNPLGQ